MDAIVWVGVVVVVLLLLLLLGGVLLKRGADERNRQQRLARAETLRAEAAERTPDVHDAAQRAQAADAEAARARAEAERAEGVAVDAHQDLAQAQAAQEDVVREADRLDPRVDDAADDYRPITGPDMKASTVDLPGDRRTD